MSDARIAAQATAGLELAEALESAARKLRAVLDPTLPRITAATPPAGVVVTRDATGPITLAIPATGVTARSDLVVLREEDWRTGPYPIPEDPDETPVWRLRVIHNVPHHITSWKQLGIPEHAIALARVTQPAWSTEVRSDMVTDLRPKPAREVVV